jgi:hypothetical protein
MIFFTWYQGEKWKKIIIIKKIKFCQGFALVNAPLL